jgi:hypothetical protein
MNVPIHRILSACLLLGTSAASAAGPFVPPVEKNPPFRRDRLPMDSNAIVTLSKQIHSLAQSGSKESAEERWLLAKAFALALALEPENDELREQIISLKDGDDFGKNSDEVHLEKIKLRLWHHYDWLSTQEAGSDGNALASFLGDVIASYDTAHPNSQSLRSRNDPDKWNGWVARLEDFKEKTKIKIPDEEKPVPDTTPQKPTTLAITLDEASVNTVLMKYDEDMRIWSHQPVTVRMKASQRTKNEEWEEDLGGFRIHIPSSEEVDWSTKDMVSSPIKDMLEKMLGSLPKGAEVEISPNKKDYDYRKNHAALTGPALVLANAAFSGKAPTGTVIGEIGQDGSMILPEHFWRHIMVLSEHGEGGRLVVPSDAVEYLSALLTLGNAEFFLKYEVLVASSPQEFFDLSAEAPKSEFADVLSKFAEIHEKAPKDQAGSYLANRFVRQRLQEIVDIAPYHYSAKLLGQHGGGSSPRYLSKKLLAAEIWRHTNIVGEIAKVDIWEINARQIIRMDEIYEETRSKIDALERYADTRDRELVRNASAMLLTVRNLAKELKSKNDEFDEYDDRYTLISNARDKMIREYEAYTEILSNLSGEPLSKDLGKRKRFRVDN